MADIRENILKSDECFATTALAILTDTFGIESLNWDPGTIVELLERKYKDIPVTTYNKLFAGITIITTDFYYKKLDTFVLLNNVLTHGYPEDLMADLEEISWGITEAQLLDPHPLVKEPEKLFSRDIITYIVEMLRLEGVLVSPRILSLIGIFNDNKEEMFSDFVDDPQMYENLVEHTNSLTAVYDTYVLEKLALLEFQLAQAGFSISRRNMTKILLPEATEKV